MLAGLRRAVHHRAVDRRHDAGLGEHRRQPAPLRAGRLQAGGGAVAAAVGALGFPLRAGVVRRQVPGALGVLGGEAHVGCRLRGLRLGLGELRPQVVGAQLGHQLPPPHGLLLLDGQADQGSRHVAADHHLGARVGDQPAFRRHPVGGGLVGEQDRGLAGQRAGDRHALLLAPGEVARQEVAPVLEADLVQRPLGVAARLAPAAALDVERVLDVLARGERREEVELLEDEADRAPPDGRQTLGPPRVDALAVHHHLAAGRRQDAAQDRQQRGLARAGRPLERHHLAAPDLEADAAQDGHGLAALAELLGDVVSADGGHDCGLLARQPRKTRAGSMPATLRNEMIAAARQSASVPANTKAAKSGVMINLRSTLARSGRSR